VGKRKIVKKRKKGKILKSFDNQSVKNSRWLPQGQEETIGIFDFRSQNGRNKIRNSSCPPPKGKGWVLGLFISLAVGCAVANSFTLRAHKTAAEAAKIGAEHCLIRGLAGLDARPAIFFASLDIRPAQAEATLIRALSPLRQNICCQYQEG
jgi:hypothetical protein